MRRSYICSRVVVLPAVAVLLGTAGCRSASRDVPIAVLTPSPAVSQPVLADAATAPPARSAPALVATGMARTCEEATAVLARISATAMRAGSQGLTMPDAGDLLQSDLSALDRLVEGSTDPAFRGAGRAAVESVRRLGMAMVQGGHVNDVVSGYFASSQVLSAVCLRAAEQRSLGPSAPGS